mgnify:CR=1 FL=1
MSFLTSILLGLVQGVTEFLPISSSGHLAIASQLLNMDRPENIPQTGSRAFPITSTWWRRP